MAQTEPVPKTNQVTDQGKPESAPGGASDASRKQEQPPDYSRALQQIESAIRDLVAKEDKQEGQRQEEREVADLEAQQHMALWAMLMFFASTASVVVTVVGVVLIWRTLHHTRRAADYAKDMVDESSSPPKPLRPPSPNRRIGEAQVRAYLTVSDVTMIIEGTIPVIECSISNSGNSPAFEIQVRVGAASSFDGDPGINNLSSWTEILAGTLPQGDTLPGQRIHVGTFQFSDEDMTMMQTERARFMARVVVTYDDVFRLRQEAAFDFFAIIHSPRKGRIWNLAPYHTFRWQVARN